MPYANHRECFRSKYISGPPESPAHVSFAASPPAQICLGPNVIPCRWKKFLHVAAGTNGIFIFNLIGDLMLGKYWLTGKHQREQL